MNKTESPSLPLLFKRLDLDLSQLLHNQRPKLLLDLEMLLLFILVIRYSKRTAETRSHNLLIATSHAEPQQRDARLADLFGLGTGDYVFLIQSLETLENFV